VELSDGSAIWAERPLPGHERPSAWRLLNGLFDFTCWIRPPSSASNPPRRRVGCFLEARSMPILNFAITIEVIRDVVGTPEADYVRLIAAADPSRSRVWVDKSRSRTASCHQFVRLAFRARNGTKFLSLPPRQTTSKLISRDRGCKAPQFAPLSSWRRVDFGDLQTIGSASVVLREGSRKRAIFRRAIRPRRP